MRRAVLAAIGWLGLLRVAAADPWSVRLESGAEADSNVARVEDQKRIAAAGARIGARIDHSGQLAGGGYLAHVSGLARLVANSEVDDENVMLYLGELRWLRPIGSPALAAGVHLTVADSFAVSGGVGARTFRNLGADALLVLGRGDDHRLTLGLGGRDFWYKPDRTFNWRGPVANARLDALVWQSPDHTRNVELAGTVGYEARSYTSKAIASCSPMGIDDCAIETPVRRRDRYQRAGIEATWTGGLVATGSYQLTVIDSNSFGQSLIRQRVVAAVTMELFGALFVTTTATLQLDQFPDEILIDDLQHQELTSLEDENRSSLQVLLTRKLSPTWSIEARGALWRDLATSTAAFRRELIYAGVLYAR